MSQRADRICLDCWRELRTASEPVGYYDVPCMRHYEANPQPKQGIRPITKADLNVERFRKLDDPDGRFQ